MTRLIVLNSHLDLLDKFDRILIFQKNKNNDNCYLIENCYIKNNKENLCKLKEKYHDLLKYLILNDKSPTNAARNTGNDDIKIDFDGNDNNDDDMDFNKTK